MNRVFDSAGPEGRVRGTPQQIIEKYQGLAYDFQLSGDRIAAENFLQHSEHYSRMLGEATREMNERREAQEAMRQSQQSQLQAQHQAQNKAAQQTQNQRQPESDVPAAIDEGALPKLNVQPDVSKTPADELFPGKNSENNLVETPENKTPKKRSVVTRRKPKAEQVDVASADPTPKEHAAADDKLG